MADVIAPHGGVREPVNRTVASEETGDFRRQAAAVKRVPVSDADLSTLYRMGDGGLSPLIGPMDGAPFRRVLDEETITHNRKAYAWTIPLSFPVDKTLACSLEAGAQVALIDERDQIVGTLQIGDIFP